MPVNRELRLLFEILGRHKGRYALGCLFLACSDVFQLAVPYLVSLVIDGLAAGTLGLDGLARLAAGVVAAAIGVALVRYCWRHFVFGAARLIERDLRQRLYEHLQALDARFFAGTKVGDLMAHATNDISAVRGAAGEGVMAGWDAIAMATITVAVMVTTVDWRLALAALLPLALLPPISWRLGEQVHQRYGVVQAAFSTLSDRVQENIAGIRVVKGFAREADQVARFDEANGAYQAAFTRLARIDVAWDPIIHLLASLATVIGLGYGGTLVLRGELTLGQFVAFNSYLAMMVWPMLALGWAMNIVQRATASIGRLQALFDERPAIADGPDARPLEAPRGELTVHGLSFRHAPDGPAVLADVTLAVGPGRTLGVFGATGSGKTTLANLLARVLEPPAGSVFLDGQDVTGLKLADVRRAIAYVPQDAFLFSRTIGENVAFDPAPHDDAAIADAARRAQLESDLAALPAGLGTEIGERGVTLSGGQRQRVGIARALLKDAPVLVLDDCMSAVDAHTEARLLEALAPERARRATILVSHRTAALAACDEIVVLTAGRVAERGTHAQLVAAGGEYARVHRLQQLEDAVEAFGA